MNSKFLHTLMFGTLLISNISRSELTIENGKAKINFDVLALDKPDKAAWALTKGGIPGAVLGGIIGCVADEVNGNSRNEYGKQGLVAGAVLLALVWEYKNFKYKRMYDKSNGLKIHGVAAKNNPEGVKAQVSYYGSQKTVEVDKENTTPLMYAGATGSIEAAGAIIDKGPKNYDVTVGTKDSTAESEQTVSWWWALTDFLGITKNKWKPAATTVKKSHTDIKKKQRTIDMQDDQGNTAVIWAAQCEEPKAMKYLLKRGANGGITNNVGENLHTLAQQSEQIKAAIDQFKKGQ
jgi:ankyrin repeat protein